MFVDSYDAERFGIRSNDKSPFRGSITIVFPIIHFRDFIARASPVEAEWTSGEVAGATFADCAGRLSSGIWLLLVFHESTSMKTRLLSAGILLGGLGLVLAQEKKPSPAPPGQSGGEIRSLSADEQAIRAADQAFVSEYNKGDTKVLAARFTEDAEVVEADGSRYRGRPLIEGRLAETFAASPGVKLVLETESIQFLSPDVAKEEGGTIITPARGAGEARRHTALLVKRDGHWLISSIREEEEPLVRPHDRLVELAWMIGEWVDEGTDSHVRVSCRWSDDTNFLVRTFAVKAQGKPALTVHQRIGWDPLARQFHSWEFDSEGGYGEGRWSRDGDRWVIKHTGVRPEGVTASATHIMARVRPDLVRWAATDRVLGSESLPQEEDYVMVRVPPPPNVPASVSVPGSPAAKATRRSQ